MPDGRRSGKLRQRFNPVRSVGKAANLVDNYGGCSPQSVRQGLIDRARLRFRQQNVDPDHTCAGVGQVGRELC
jgi:hypothetical protein